MWIENVHRNRINTGVRSFAPLVTKMRPWGILHTRRPRGLDFKKWNMTLFAANKLAMDQNPGTLLFTPHPPKKNDVDVCSSQQNMVFHRSWSILSCLVAWLYHPKSWPSPENPSACTAETSARGRWCGRARPATGVGMWHQEFQPFPGTSGNSYYIDLYSNLPRPILTLIYP